MIDDPIVAEIHRLREAYAAEFNGDFEAMYEDIKEYERQCGRPIVSFADETPTSFARLPLLKADADDMPLLSPVNK